MSSRRTFIKKSVAVPIILFSGGLFESFRNPAQRRIRGTEEKLRIIIETDAGGDPDDEQSLVRYLLYANEFDIEGIIANRPMARERENINPVRDGLGIVKSMINAYGQCYSYLVSNDSDYPRPEELHKLTVAGYDDTEDGVDLIIRSVDSPDSRPVWFCNWGTDSGSAVSCLKRALDKVLKERGPEGYAKFKSRLRLSSADKFGEHTTQIEPPFTIWIDTLRPAIDNKRWYHRFSPITAAAGGFNIERDVRTSHGPLGAMYPVNTGYPQKEGDTMTFLYLLPMGLSDPEEPVWGSWGGRYGHNGEHTGKHYYWANQTDRWNGSENRDNTLARWAVAFQNDFRARMEWCVKPYRESNHHPVAIINGEKGNEIIYIDAAPGKKIDLNAGKSFDPDGRNLFPRWFIYNEAGTFKDEISLSASSGMRTSLIVPSVEKPETIHIVLELSNDGSPSLFSYRRVIINIKPRKE